jgi:hypothetical protein
MSAEGFVFTTLCYSSSVLLWPPPPGHCRWPLPSAPPNSGEATNGWIVTSCSLIRPLLLPRIESPDFPLFPIFGVNVAVSKFIKLTKHSGRQSLGSAQGDGVARCRAELGQCSGGTQAESDCTEHLSTASRATPMCAASSHSTRSPPTSMTTVNCGGCPTSPRTSPCSAWSWTTSCGCRRVRSPRGPPLPCLSRSPAIACTSPSTSSRTPASGRSLGCSRMAPMLRGRPPSPRSVSSLVTRRVLRSCSRSGFAPSWPPRSRSRHCACRPRPLRPSSCSRTTGTATEESRQELTATRRQGSQASLRADGSDARETGATEATQEKQEHAGSMVFFEWVRSRS